MIGLKVITLLCVVCVVVVQSVDYVIPTPIFEAFKPKGFRFALPGKPKQMNVKV